MSEEYNKGLYDVYQKSSENIGEIQQVVMLYDGAINFIKQAKEAIIAQDYEKRYNLINKAIAIITGLNSCLEFNDNTIETAKALDEFYSMIDMRLLYIQCDDSLESCDKVIQDLTQMRDAWSSIEQSADSQSSENQENTKKTQSTSEGAGLHINA